MKLNTNKLVRVSLCALEDTKNPTCRGRWDLLLDINLDGQILPLVAAEVLTVRLFILQRLIETDGKLEI